MTTRRHFINKMLTGSSAAFLFFNSELLAKISEYVSEQGSKIPADQLAYDEDFWGRIQQAFEVDRSIINLNNGGVSPNPASVNSALKRYIDYSNKGPSYFMWQHLEPNIELVREKLSYAFGADKEEIAITRNASESLENIQFGLKLKAGDEIIITTQDYPRMLTTWEQRKRRDEIVIKKVAYSVPVKSFDELISKIEKAITSKTKVIHISHVIFLTGQIFPVKEICKIAHSKGIPVIVDGAHSFYHFPFMLEDLKCDFFGTSLHKWTYAPIGTGFLYVKKDLIKEIWPLMAADEKLDGDIRKFEEIGTHPAANHNAIAEALAFNETIGISRKAERLRYLQLRWINRLREYDNAKFLVDIDNPSQWCGIVNVHLDKTDPVKLTNYLMNKHRIFCVPIIHNEFKGIRITPNIYTLLSEIDIFANVMEKAARGEIKEIFE
jgi:selenocysteine lyase/cysteine desulfurase